MATMASRTSRILPLRRLSTIVNISLPSTKKVLHIKREKSKLLYMVERKRELNLVYVNWTWFTWTKSYTTPETNCENPWRRVECLSNKWDPWLGKKWSNFALWNCTQT